MQNVIKYVSICCERKKRTASIISEQRVITHDSKIWKQAFESVFFKSINEERHTRLDMMKL